MKWVRWLQRQLADLLFGKDELKDLEWPSTTPPEED
jgi:hypothetical protein